MSEEDYSNVALRLYLKKYVVTIVAIVSALAIIVLLGWQFDISIIKRPLLGLVAMNPVTALAFILSSLSLLFFLNKHRKRSFYSIAASLAWIVVIIGAIRLVAIITVYDIGVDKWLFTEKLAIDMVGNMSNSMAPNTAFNFILSGLSLLFFGSESSKKNAISQYLSLVTLLISLLSITGYLYGASSFYGLPSYIPMAIHSAICFLLLSIAIIIAQGDKGFAADLTSPYPGGTMARLLLPMAVIAPIILGLIRIYGEEAGLYTTPFGTAMFATVNIIIFIVLIWKGSNSINITHLARMMAEEKLLQFTKELEEKVDERTRELRNTEQRFRGLIENNVDIISMTDKNFKPIYRSPSSDRITGWTSEERERMGGGSDETHPEDVVAFRNILQQVSLNHGKPYKVAFRTKHKLGHYIWLEGIATNKLQSPGINAIVFNLHDITERKIAEMKLERSETRFRSLLENNSDIITLLDEKFQIIYRSPSAERITGWTDKDRAETNLIEHMHPDDVEPFKNVINEMFIYPGKSFNVSMRTKHKDGHYIWLEGFINNMLPDPNIGGILSNLKDVTRRKEAEKELERSEKRFRALIENSHDAIMLVDENMTVFYQSPLVERMTGISLDERTANPGVRYTHPDDVEIINEIFSKVKNSQGINFSFKIRMLHKRGVYIWIEGVLTNLLHDESVRAIVCNFKDITYRIQTEEKVRKNTLELERSNKELEQFAYIASHDLQEPLRMVGSYVQLLERRYKDKLDDDANEFIGYAVDGVTRMKQLINDLLSFSRIHKTGGASVVDLSKILNMVLKNLSASIEESGAQINIGNMPVLNAEPTLMLQLFQNLISNAIKFRTEGTIPVIDIEAIKEDEIWYISVKDNGIGIDEQYAEQVFVIFKQLNLKSQYSGTGIGLAIARKIVEKHGGKIWFESKPGEGTKFCFTIKSQPNEAN